MNTGKSPLLSFSNAQLEWDEDNKPRSTLYGDIYFSSVDAVGESEYVFLEKNKLKQRWANIQSDRFIIAECGFGSGLNFLNTCKLWSENASKNSRLHYIACENHPLLKEDLLRLHTQWPQLSSYSEELLKHYPEHTAGIHRLHLQIGAKSIILDLLYDDACRSLNSIFQNNGCRVDAWFLDGFSPRLNPEMWSDELLDVISRLSKSGTTLSTYSVAGKFRRALASLGFTVTKEVGFAKKRHMLSATHNGHSPTQTSTDLPWFSLPEPIKPKHKHVTIIGAGLAGCSTAYAMARKGWRVSLIERTEEIATMASGNPQGIIHFKLSKDSGALTHFTQQGYLYAIRQYQSLAKQHDIEWQQCGMLQLAHNPSQQVRQAEIIQQNLYSNKIFQPLSAEQSSTKAGILLSMGGLFFSESGWLNPQALCQAYSKHPLITVHLQTEAIELKKINQHWLVIIETSKGRGEVFATSDAVVIANSVDANKFSFTEHYPLIPNKGQVDFFNCSSASQALQTVLCTNAYITPASKAQHSIGGHFIANTSESSGSSKATEENISLLEGFLPEIASQFRGQKNSTSRAAIRSSTPDYLPIVGPVEKLSACKALYKGLSQNAKKKIETPAIYEENLFVNIAHGSHGLSSTPIAAEYIAALLEQEPLPIQNEIINCLHPLRFLIRDLKKQNV